MTASRILGPLAAAGLAAAVLATLLTTGWTEPGMTSVPSGVHVGIPIARVLLYLGAVAVVGAALLPLLLGSTDRGPSGRRDIGVVLRRVRPVAVGGAAGWLLGALASVLLPAWEISAADGRGFPSADDLLRYLDAVPAGRGLLLSAGAALVSLLLAAWAVRTGERVPAGVRLGVALAGLLPLPLTGHAASRSWNDLLTVGMELHVVAATVWTGGLGAAVAFLAARPALLTIAMPRYSQVATVCVLLVGVTGVLTGLVELGRGAPGMFPESLWDTGYGVLVLIKTAVVAAVGGIAVVVKRTMMPLIARGRPSTVAVWCGVELALLGVAFGVAAVLTRSAVTAL